MKTTGFKISAALAKHEVARAAAEEKFQESLLIFSGEEKDSPTTVDDVILRHDRAMAELQAAQGAYNAMVSVSVDYGKTGQTMTLAQAIKMLGVEIRAANRWKTVAAGEKKRGYLYREGPADVRSKDNVYAQRTIAREVAGKLSAQAFARAQAIRAAIALGNAREMEVPVEPGLFD